jgi:CHAT domain-containing protein/tetratricopeptide (TPR) repeat protein
MRRQRRYYLPWLFGLTMLLSQAVTARAQTAPAGATPASACVTLSQHLPAVAPDDVAGSLKALVDCGYELKGQSALAGAGRLFARAIDIARSHPDAKRDLLAASLNGYGYTLFASGQAERAEPFLTESAQISEAIGDKNGMAEAANYFGQLRNMQGRYDEARAYHLRSLELWDQLGDQHGVAIGLNNVGGMYRATGDYASALDYFQRSLDSLQQQGDRRRSATVLDNMGTVVRRLGDYPRGLLLAQQALAIRESFDDQAGIAKSFDSLSEVYQAQGNYGAALAALAHSLELRRSLGLAHATAESLNNIAVVHEALGNYRQAIRYLRESRALNHAKVGSTALLAEIDTHLGELYLQDGQLALARSSLRRSLAVCAQFNYRTQAADTQYVLARVYVAGHRLGDAMTVLQRSLSARLALGDRRGQADVLIELAELDRLRGHPAEGLQHVTEAEALAEAMELPETEWRALTLVGRLQLARGHRDDARAALDRAIAVLETMRSQNPAGEESRSRFFSDRVAPYQERVALALAEADTATALSLAERAKARVLLDVIRGSVPSITHAMTVDERAHEVQLRQALSSASSALVIAAGAAAPDQARVTALRAARTARRLEYEEFQERLYAAHPELRVSRGASQTIDVRAAQALVTSPTSAIIEFVSGPDRTVALVVTAAGICARRLPASTGDIARQVDLFRTRLADRDLRIAVSARALYDLVLGPMQALLADKTDLIIVPDGALWDLPFQALQSSAHRYLIEQAAISYAPSITVLREMQRRRPAHPASRTLLAFASPAAGVAVEPAEVAEVAEVQQLAALYGSAARLHVGADAREERWRTDAPDYRVVHVAAHGVLDNRSPLYSYVQLATPEQPGADDGHLEAWEIMQVPLSADLVILSACDTARGRFAAGEGVLGLMWALFVAGSPATLVSQWKVDSSASAALMVDFHRQWQAARGLSKARALRAAALAALSTREFAHPFYWAGFILVGDGR